MPGPADILLAAGFAQMVKLRPSRLSVYPGNIVLEGTIDDAPALTDPIGDNVALAETPVYARVSVPSGTIPNPRLVTHFVCDGRTYKAIRFEATPGNSWSWSWLCEATRTR